MNSFSLRSTSSLLILGLLCISSLKAAPGGNEDPPPEPAHTISLRDSSNNAAAPAAGEAARAAATPRLNLPSQNRDQMRQRQMEQQARWIASRTRRRDRMHEHTERKMHSSERNESRPTVQVSGRPLSARPARKIPETRRLQSAVATPAAAGPAPTGLAPRNPLARQEAVISLTTRGNGRQQDNLSLGIMPVSAASAAALTSLRNESSVVERGEWEREPGGGMHSLREQMEAAANPAAAAAAAAARAAAGRAAAPVRPKLFSLPDDVLESALTWVPICDMGNVRRVCKYWNLLTHQSSFYESLFDLLDVRGNIPENERDWALQAGEEFRIALQKKQIHYPILEAAIYLGIPTAWEIRVTNRINDLSEPVAILNNQPFADDNASKAANEEKANNPGPLQAIAERVRINALLNGLYGYDRSAKQAKDLIEILASNPKNPSYAWAINQLMYLCRSGLGAPKNSKRVDDLIKEIIDNPNHPFYKQASNYDIEELEQHLDVHYRFFINRPFLESITNHPQHRLCLWANTKKIAFYGIGASGYPHDISKALEMLEKLGDGRLVTLRFYSAMGYIVMAYSCDRDGKKENGVKEALPLIKKIAFDPKHYLHGWAKERLEKMK